MMRPACRVLYCMGEQTRRHSDDVAPQAQHSTVIQNCSDKLSPSTFSHRMRLAVCWNGRERLASEIITGHPSGAAGAHARPVACPRTGVHQHGDCKAPEQPDPSKCDPLYGLRKPVSKCCSSRWLTVVLCPDRAEEQRHSVTGTE